MATNVDQLRMLLVEDEPELRVLMEENLKEIFAPRIVNLETAADGVIGFYKSTMEKFDLIISDYWMPKNNGLELLSKIRSGGFNKETPIVFVSAYIDQVESFLKETKAIDGVFALAKPCKFEDLASLVRKLVK